MAKRKASIAVAGRHYDLEHPVNESIEIIEMVMQRENIPPESRFSICQALRYLLRCGVKTDEWAEDIEKAENYLHRATTGEWNTAKG